MLAVNWSEKDGPTRLSKNAATAVDIKDLLQYFRTAGATGATKIFLIYEQLAKTNHASYDRVVVKSEPETSFTKVKLEKDLVTAPKRKQRLTLNLAPKVSFFMYRTIRFIYFLLTSFLV